MEGSVPPCTSLEQLLFILKILFATFTKQTTLIKRLTVVSLPLQLGFLGLVIVALLVDLADNDTVHSFVV
jgi:hypothetical protein